MIFDCIRYISRLDKDILGTNIPEHIEQRLNDNIGMLQSINTKKPTWLLYLLQKRGNL